jgi:DUF1680 family protein
VKKQSGISRRGFGAALAGVSAIAQQASAQQAPAQPQAPAAPAPPRRQTPPPDVPPFEPPLEFTRKDAPIKVQPFPLSQVRLLPGIYKDAEAANRGYMSRLSADQLLYNFRQNVGLPVTPIHNLGGWELPPDPRNTSELRGHFTGHFLSASALLYASTGDKEAKAKGDFMVAELAKCQDKLPGGYLSAFPTSYFDRLDARTNVWAPFYTIHKIMAGLFDMSQLAGNKQALEVVQRMSEWADTWSASKTPEHMQDILNTEYGGMAETLYNLTAATGNDRWAKAGDRFNKKRFLNPLALRRDELQRLHMNTHVPQVIAAARRYEISSDVRFHDVADFFWSEVTGARSYVTAGSSNAESWQVPPRQLGAELKRSVNTQECCCSYNMLKLTRQLYSWDPNPRYFDYYERAMLNHRIGTIHAANGHTQYFLSLTTGAYKTFCSEDASFWCCTGTGVEEYAKLADSIYWRDQQGLYVNQFIASELDWSEKGLKVRQETHFPEQQSTAIVFTAAKPVQLAVRLRIPSWLESSPTVKLNGKQLDASAAPGSYLTLNRLWKTGDRIEMQLPMRLSVEALPDEPQTQAALYGPLVLAGDLGAEGLTEQSFTGSQGPRVQPGSITAPAIARPSKDPTSWIQPGDKPLTFRTAGQRQQLALVPLNTLFDKRYVVYWQVG